MFKSFENVLNEELEEHNHEIEKLEAAQQMLQKHRVELKHSNVNFHKNLNDVEQFVSMLSLNRQSLSKSRKALIQY